MFENIDLSKKADKKAYKEVIENLENRLGELQRRIKALKIPVTIVFDGWGASGKGTLINRLILPLDPRELNVYSSNKLTEDEMLRPFLWTYWTKTPQRGRMSVFGKSWYRRIFKEEVDYKSDIEGIKSKEDLQTYFEDIRAFEKQLTDDGNVIIKFFLHISKEEQKDRFDKLQRNPVTSWRVTKEDWNQNQHYKKYLELTEEMIQHTHTDYAPWSVIEATDRRFAEIKIFKIIIDTLEQKIAEVEDENAKQLQNMIKSETKQYNNPSILSNIDLTKDITKEEYKRKLKKYQDEIMELENLIYTKRIPVVILYEGWDAAGKGGNIKRLTENMDPRGYEVIPIAAPSELEKEHHYLWRFWNKIPKDGHIAIFDRTWYGRVMVERIEGFCSENEWKRAYKEINDMEKQLVNHGTVVIKFWIHIDKDEQLKRFKAREEDVLKQWKITDEDWRNREKWDLYEQAVDEMLFRTSTEQAPWTIVESNSKYYARIKVLEKVISEIKKRI